MVVGWLQLANEVDSGAAAGCSPVAHFDVELTRAHSTTCPWSWSALSGSVIWASEPRPWESRTRYIWTEWRGRHTPWRDPPWSSRSIFHVHAPSPPPGQTLTSTRRQPSNNPCSPHLLQVATLAHHLGLHRPRQPHLPISQPTRRRAHIPTDHVRARADKDPCGCVIIREREGRSQKCCWWVGEYGFGEGQDRGCDDNGGRDWDFGEVSKWSSVVLRDGKTYTSS